jgi:hypothetical protein
MEIHHPFSFHEPPDQLSGEQVKWKAKLLKCPSTSGLKHPATRCAERVQGSDMVHNTACYRLIARKVLMKIVCSHSPKLFLQCVISCRTEVDND